MSATSLGMPGGTAETPVSRLESDGVVTDSRDRTADRYPHAVVGVGVPVSFLYEPGELEFLIIWKIEHITREGCDQCQRELAGLLQDWRSRSESLGLPLAE